MLSAINISPSKGASYYRNEDSIESAGHWFGRGAELLGLRDQVHHQDFRAVLYGHSPNHHFRLRQHQRSCQATPTHGRTIQTMERAATDLTFSAPKSVSIVALVNEDHRVITAHQQAVTSLLTTIQSEHLRTRIQVNGKRDKIPTDNLLAATFVHRTSRNLDPQLHSHCLVMNTTQGPDGKWRSLENTEFFKHHLVSLSMSYRQELATNLHRLGYEITWGNSHCFEISSVHPALIAEFSSRRKEILQAAKSLSRGARQVATLTTRVPKEHGVFSELQTAIWKQQAINTLSRVAPVPSMEPVSASSVPSEPPTEPVTPAKALPRHRKYIPLRRPSSGPHRGISR